MDPIGNIPPFLSILKSVPVERRRLVLMREILLAYGVLLVFLFLGKYLLRFLRLEQETLSIAGGIVLFLIALRMIFPREGRRRRRAARRRAVSGAARDSAVCRPIDARRAAAVAARVAGRQHVAAHRDDDCLGDRRDDSAELDVLLSPAARARPHRHRAAHGDAARDGLGADAGERVENACYGPARVTLPFGRVYR